MAAFDKPITIQKLDEETEKWTDLFKLHAKVNKSNDLNTRTLDPRAHQLPECLKFVISNR